MEVDGTLPVRGRPGDDLLGAAEAGDWVRYERIHKRAPTRGALTDWVADTEQKEGRAPSRGAPTD